MIFKLLGGFILHQYQTDLFCSSLYSDLFCYLLLLLIFIL